MSTHRWRLELWQQPASKANQASSWVDLAGQFAFDYSRADETHRLNALQIWIQNEEYPSIPLILPMLKYASVTHGFVFEVSTMFAQIELKRNAVLRLLDCKTHTYLKEWIFNVSTESQDPIFRAIQDEQSSGVWLYGREGKAGRNYRFTPLTLVLGPGFIQDPIIESIIKQMRKRFHDDELDLCTKIVARKREALEVAKAALEAAEAYERQTRSRIERGLPEGALPPSPPLQMDSESSLIFTSS
jgi:hypothetical protein